MSRETVMRRVHSMKVPPKGQDEASEKRKVMARLADGSTEEGREETEKKLQEWTEKGNRKNCRNGLRRQVKRLRKKTQRSLWKAGIHKKQLERGLQTDKKRGRRNGEQYGGAYQPCAVGKNEFTSDGMVQAGCRQPVAIRIYWKNGGDMLELVKRQKEEETEECEEDEKYFSASEILSWEKKQV